MLDKQTQLQIIESALNGYAGKKIRHPTYTMICCPYHDDATPSGRISHNSSSYAPGFFYCYGCGAKRKWGELADTMGWDKFTGEKPDDRYAYKVIEKPITDEEEADNFELSELPPHKVWRTFPTDFLSDIGCKLGTYHSGRKFVYLPVIIGGRERGYIRAAMRKHPDVPSYLNKAGTWSKRYGLFPFDYAIEHMRNKTMTLVEGPRDALRLLSHGIPAMSILGTQTWTSNKVRLLELHGVERAVLMFDGDPAGMDATDRIAPDVRQLLDTHIIKLWAMRKSPYHMWSKQDIEERKATKSTLWDPGNCPEYILRKIQRKYYA